MNSYLKTRRALINNEKPKAVPFVLSAVRSVLFNEEINKIANTVKTEKLTAKEMVSKFNIGRFKANQISAVVNSGMELSLVNSDKKKPTEIPISAPKLYYSISMLPANGMSQKELDLAAAVVSQVLKLYNKDSGNIQLPLMADQQFEVREAR